MADDEKSLRLFIALDLPELLRRELGDRVKILQSALDGQTLRWVPGPNRHLTLLFIGNTPAEAVNDITSTLDRVAAMHSPFPLHLTSHGAFPRAAHPSVLWMGLDGGDPLQTLASDLSNAMGLEAETKPFVPHLTVARVPSQAGRKERKQIGPILKDLKDWESPPSGMAETMSLYQSRLDASGAQYTQLHSAELTRESGSCSGIGAGCLFLHGVFPRDLRGG